MNGLLAYQVYSGMATHFHRGSYDGWKYNFKTGVKADTFAKKKRLVYQYAAIEREFNTPIELIKFYYPAFAKFGYVKPENVFLIRKEYKNFTTIDKKENYQLFLTKLCGKIDSIDSLFDTKTSVIPTIYHLLETEDRDNVIILFTVIPELNRIVGSDYFVFDKWLAEIDFDKKFYSLYTSSDELKQYKQTTFDIFNRNLKIL